MLRGGPPLIRLSILCRQESAVTKTPISRQWSSITPTVRTVNPAEFTSHGLILSLRHIIQRPSRYIFLTQPIRDPHFLPLNCSIQPLHRSVTTMNCLPDWEPVVYGKISAVEPSRDTAILLSNGPCPRWVLTEHCTWYGRA